MFDPNNVLFKETNDVVAEFSDSSKNSGFVEAEYTSSGVVVLRATEKKENNLDLKTISKLI